SRAPSPRLSSRPPKPNASADEARQPEAPFSEAPFQRHRFRGTVFRISINGIDSNTIDSYSIDMRISELSTATDVSVASIKYYIREGLIPSGDRVGYNQTRYGNQHIARLKLIGALVNQSS